MKKSLAVALLSAAVVTTTQAHASCDSLVDRLSQQIQGKGIPESQYSLEVLPTAEAKQADGKIIGTCEGQTHQVVYHRNGGEHSNDASDNSQEADSAPNPSDDQAAPVPGSKPGSFKGSVQPAGSGNGSSTTPMSGEAPNEAIESAHSDD